MLFYVYIMCRLMHALKPIGLMNLNSFRLIRCNNSYCSPGEFLRLFWAFCLLLFNSPHCVISFTRTPGTLSQNFQDAHAPLRRVPVVFYSVLSTRVILNIRSVMQGGSEFSESDLQTELHTMYAEPGDAQRLPMMLVNEGCAERNLDVQDVGSWS